MGNSIPGEQDPRFHLDPDRFPQRLELELPEELVDELQRVADEMGCSMPELVHNLLCNYVEEQAKEL